MVFKREKIEDILKLIRSSDSWAEEEFIPGKSLVRYSGAVFGEEESSAFVESFLGGWFGVGPKAREFERQFAEYTGANYGLFTNSGSSANLLAVSSLKSRKLNNHRLRDGDEVIIGAFCFPTTLTPLLLTNLRPRFVDSEVGTYTIKPETIEEAITEQTRAVMLTHHLGNPNQLDEIIRICNERGLFLIEDCCDGLGSKYNNRMIGNFGELATFSFYPAHHITTGEGGMVVSNYKNLIKAALGVRDWGRDCFCDSRCQNPNGECGRRFTAKHGDLPEGFDHKYTYGELGLNLKPLECQAAFGLEQLKKFPGFAQRRRENFRRLDNFFKDYQDLFVLPQKVNDKADPVWFAYPLTVKTDKFSRSDIVKYLEDRKIQTRPFFSGNILRHPLFYGNEDLAGKYSVSGSLKNSDTITENSFFLGVYPGIDKARMDYVLETLQEFLKKHR